MSKTYSGDFAQEIAFPLSGIGTGGVSISGLGELIDWELDGRANKDTRNEYTHFAIKAERKGEVLDARVLHGDRLTGLSGTELAAHHHSWGYGQGINRTSLAGLAHFEDVTFQGEFPFARLQYHSEKMPADIKLEAFNPFIPGDEDNSSLPAAFFNWEIKNTSDEVTEYTLAFSVGDPFRIREGGCSFYEKTGDVSSITMKSRHLSPEDRKYGELMISTDCPDVSYQEYWFRSGWFDDVTTFWREFCTSGKLQNRHYDDDDPRGQMDVGDMCTLAAHVLLQPGESRTIRFVMTWYFPHFVKYWSKEETVWDHEYVRRFVSAAAVKSYAYEHRDDLYQRSKKFSRALVEMSLPEEAIEAAAANLCVLKSATCLRLENGEFWAFEGTNGHSGSCEGTCDHVWQYQYALPFLFPKFARQILEIDYLHDMKESGEMMFRTMVPLGSGISDFRACVDGQMGSVLRAYREWKLSGDSEWLKKWWPYVKKSVEYAWSPDNRDRWDPEKKGVITGRQHHTLDVELFGPNAWLTGFYLAALKAGAEMAEYLGEAETAEEYRSIFQSGQAYLEQHLFNGRHYIQQIDVKDSSVLDPYKENDPGVTYYWNDEKKELKYQYAEGCEIDQMVAQWHGNLMGLGDIFDPKHRKIALKTMYDLSFMSMRDMANPCRIFAVNDEKGLPICVWADDVDKPKIPLPYTEECMTGFEYAAAGLMITEGMIEEGMEVIKAIRDRYDGKKRNPFSEIECGASYARSMASFALPAAFSGFRFDMVKQEIGFCPVVKERPHQTFWSMDGAWGRAKIGEENITLLVDEGELRLQAFLMESEEKAVKARKLIIDEADVPFEREGQRIRFDRPIRIGSSLRIELDA